MDQYSMKPVARFIQDEHSIDITYNKVVFDYYDYITFVSHKVANLLWAIEESTYIITTNVIKSNALARIQIWVIQYYLIKQ